MECKICGFDGKCFVVEVSYRFDGLLDVFSHVWADGQPTETVTTVRCPECLSEMLSLKGVLDDESVY